MKIVLITGGSGYIGSTITAMLLEQQYRVVNLDLVPSTNDWIRSHNNYDYIECDLSSSSKILCEVYKRLLHLNKGDEWFGLIHMAAWKDLPGSYDNPYEYYRNNLKSTINAVQLANQVGCKTVIFSSSAGVYDDNLTGAVTEDAVNVKGDSPYGYTKVVGERIVTDMCKQYSMNSFNLRYCNPIGTYDGISVDKSTSMFGNILTHLNDGKFTICGGDWDTPDGTCIRDYIDIRDIALAHIHFLNFTAISKRRLVNDTVNVGTGIGVSCLQACDAVKLVHPNFNWTIGPRREGDAPGSYADVTKLHQYGFKCRYSLDETISNLLLFK